MNLERISIAWLTAWGISYIATALIAPEIAGTNTNNNITSAFYFLTGILFIMALILRHIGYKRQTSRYISDIILIILTFFEIVSGVASWTGVVTWNVPFANKELFQVTMGFMDFVSAVFMLILILPEN